jgi:hypothetical protein
MAVLVDFFVEQETEYAVQPGGDAVFMLLFDHEDIADIAINVEASLSGGRQESFVHGQGLLSHLFSSAAWAKNEQLNQTGSQDRAPQTTPNGMF